MTDAPAEDYSSAPGSQRLRLGQQIASYTIDGPIGRGGMAEVYLATHVALDRTVALKILISELQADPTFPLRFIREAKTVAKLNHPNIVTIFDFSDKGEYPYLVMEFAPRGTLRQGAKGFTTLKDAVDALLPVCEALSFAHQRGVVHRDIKSDNVLINEHGAPLLADFGLARLVCESLDYSGAGTAEGSPQYIAPEQAMGEEVDLRADIYSLGILAYEMIVGRVPFDGQTPLEIIFQHLTADPPSILAALEDAPVRLDLAIKRATAKRPEDRFGSVAEFVVELRAVAEQAPDLKINRAAGSESSGPVDNTPASEPGTATRIESIGSETVTTGSAMATVAGVAPGHVTDDPLAASGAAPWSVEKYLKSRVRTVSRPSALGSWQSLVLGMTVFGLLCLDLFCGWRGIEGQQVTGPLSGVANTVFAHVTVIRDVLASLVFALGVLNATLMRVAILDDHPVSMRTYQRLRQDHRFIGYLAISTAISVQILTWIEIWRIGEGTTRAVLNLVVGPALLMLAVWKVVVVRWVPTKRRYLALYGIGLGVLSFLVLAINTAPLIWRGF